MQLLLLFAPYLSIAQKTNLSAQFGLNLGSFGLDYANSTIPSYQGTISLLYNSYAKYDLMVKLRYYSFKYDFDFKDKEVINHIGIGFFVGGRFYFDKHTNESSSNLFYPYFEIFPGIMISHSKVKVLTGSSYSYTEFKNTEYKIGYFSISSGSAIKIAKGIYLDANIDYLWPSGIVSGNLGLMATI